MSTSSNDATKSFAKSDKNEESFIEYAFIYRTTMHWAKRQFNAASEVERKG